MRSHESAEDYLEAILVIGRKRGAVRSVDVANELGFSKPSVSVAMKKLRDAASIETDADGFISLTAEGLRLAERVYERHTLLTKWLSNLGVDPATAAEDACRIEHVISEASFTAIKKLVSP
ncbi:DtxR family transcriptional regulator [Clostridia bacterium]|nr:DtxR family transcriptional regulator [Clostridia bacterium]